MKHFAKYESPIGTLLLESDDEFITKIELVDDKNLSQDIEDESSNFVFAKCNYDLILILRINKF